MTELTTLFGLLKTGWDLEQAMILHLGGDGKENPGWMTTYLAEVERQKEIKAESLPPVKSWVAANEFRKWPDEQMPVGVVLSPGLAEEPLRDGDGKYRAKWHVGVAVVVKGRKRSETAETAKLYAAAVRAAVLQHPSLGGFAQGVTWKDESYTDLPMETERTLGSAQLVFEVEVEDVIQSLAGLVEIPEDPYDVPDAWSEIESAEVTVTQQEEEE